MKKGKFTITGINGEEERSGLVSEHFGLHKEDRPAYDYTGRRSPKKYVITHLKTGLSMPSNGLIRYSDFKELIKRLEESNIPWNGPLKKIKKFGKRYQDIKLSVMRM